MCLRAEEGAVIADKTVLKMMREMGIRCGIRRETAYHRYNSYRGVVGRTFENVIARDFDAGAPWRKLGTDVTEFKVAGGKAYWAPTLDFCTKEIVASDISTTPDMAQQARMLDELLPKIPEGAAPTMHSDRGWQYQHASYTSRLEAAGIVQSMSRKANCIDNAATEQLFGHVKDEFYRGREWKTFEDFKRDLEEYIVHWNTSRRQVRLKGLTPEEFRNQALAASSRYLGRPRFGAQFTRAAGSFCMSCLVVANALESGNDLDLDQTASRKGGNLEGAARGERGLELGGVDLVHGGEVGDVGQVDRGLDDIGKGSAGSGQQGLNVGEGLLGLGLDALGHLAGRGIDAQLAGQEHHVAGLDTGGIRADGCGCVIGRHDGLAHVFLLTIR